LAISQAKSAVANDIYIKEEPHEDYINFNSHEYEDFNYSRKIQIDDYEYDYGNYNNIIGNGYFESVDFFL